MMQRHEMALDGIMLDDRENYIGFLQDLSNVGLTIQSEAMQMLRTGDAGCLDDIESLMGHVQKHVTRIRRIIDRKGTFESGYSVGHMQGFSTGKEQGYEEGVRDTHQSHPHLQPHLEQIAKNGAGLTIISIERGAGRDFPNR